MDNKFSIGTLILLFIFNITSIHSQVTIKETSSIVQLMRSYKTAKQSETTIKAWRIQIITTDDRRKMEQARYKFRSLYPDIKSSWVHESPYYKVKVGAYKTKIELQGFLMELKGHFRGVIPIVEQIKKEDLIM